MVAVQSIMESREKAGPSERPNMQSANVFKGFTNRASGGANVYWAAGEGIGRPLVWMCHPGNTPLSQKCLCALPWQLPTCWRKLKPLWMCFWGEGRQTGWWRESRNDWDIFFSFFVPEEMKQAVHTLWTAKHWWTHSHTHLHTHSLTKPWPGLHFFPQISFSFY